MTLPRIFFLIIIITVAACTLVINTQNMSHETGGKRGSPLHIALDGG